MPKLQDGKDNRNSLIHRKPNLRLDPTCHFGLYVINCDVAFETVVLIDLIFEAVSHLTT